MTYTRGSSFAVSASQRLRAIWTGRECETISPSRSLSRNGDRKLYQRPESFVDLLHFAHFDPESNTFSYADTDGVICGSVVEIFTVDAEGRHDDQIAALRDAVTQSLHGMPEVDGSPWVLQVYVQDEPVISLSLDIRKYCEKHGIPSKYQTRFLDTIDHHLLLLSQSGGVFHDPGNGARWGARYRRVRAVLYRVFPKTRVLRGVDMDPAESVVEVTDRFVSVLRGAGFRFSRYNAAGLVTWVRSMLSDSEKPSDLTECDYAFVDLAELVVTHAPVSDADLRVWKIGPTLHRVVTIDRTLHAPRVGHLTLEHRTAHDASVLMDQLPERSIVCLTTVFEPQNEIALGVEQVRRAAIGGSAGAELTARDGDSALATLATGHKAFPTWMTVLVRADSDKQLAANTTSAVSVLKRAGFDPIETESDLVALSALPLSLPMGYKPHLERRTHRARLMWDEHIANLLPMYGAGSGTGHPGMLFWNASGGPFTIDPLNSTDREMSAHSLILGPTGSGKSALLVYLACWLMAVHKPHLVIIDVGGSFKLLGDYLSAEGFSVNAVRLNPETDVSLPPFAHAQRLLESDGRDSQHQMKDGRDLLAEMELAARYMITQGKPSEDDRLHTEDRLTLREAILWAADTARIDGREQTMIDDVVRALKALGAGKPLLNQSAGLPKARRPRADEMSSAMAVFCTGANARYFNKPATPLPDADVTIVDLDHLVRPGNEDALVVAYMGLMNQINDDIERRRGSGRPTVVINDEAHVTTTNPLLASYVVKASKMWRKLGAWLWMATQNLRDFPDQSASILNQAEFWFCLSMPREEIEQIARFHELSDDERSLLANARKEPGRFVEGVLLSRKPASLFRNVPPALCLALAQTEQREYAHRQSLMQRFNCTELEAAERIAADIEKQRRNT